MSKFTAKDQWKKFTREQRIQIKAPEMLELLKTFVDIYLEDHDLGMYSENSDLKRACNLIKEIG